MKMKQLLAGVLALGTALMTLADEPYRLHRYDSFMGTPPMEGATVFLGNSITNMHNWNEAFNSDTHIINRGNSGGLAYEWIQQIEAITDFKPAKLFIGIGTNDISSGQSVESVVEDISLIVDRVKLASPRTKIHIQTILPRSNNGDYCMPRINEVNSRLSAKYAGSDVTVIYLSDVMAGMRTQSGSGVDSYAPDGLHPSGKGYRVWVNHIKDYVNGEVGYFDGAYNSIITSVSNPDRIGQFSLLPVKNTDVLFLGDEMVENGEWNELLRNFNVKKRSNGYGHGGIGLAAAKNYMTVSLTTNTEKQKAPEKVLIYCGISELTNTSVDAAAYKTSYADLVNHIHTLAPTTEVVAVSILPVSAQAAKAAEFNTALQELAAADDKLTYVDITTGMNADCYQGNYVNGLGYVTIANNLAPVIGNCNPVSVDEYEQYYDARQNRKQLGLLYNKVYKALNKTNVDQAGGYTTEGVAQLQALKTAIGNELAKCGNPSEVLADFTQQVNEAMSKVAMPGTFDGRYYRLTSVREGRSLGVVNGALAGQVVEADITRGGDIWRFDPRTDGTFDIMTYNGYYLVPGSTASKTKPSFGWSISHSNTVPGTYVITASSGGTNYQINQASGATTIHNWYGLSFPNRDDQGCAYYFYEYDGAMEPEQVVTDRWIKMKFMNGYNSSIVTTKNRVTTLSPGVDRSNGLYEIQYAAAPSFPCEEYIFMSLNADGTRSFRFPSGHYISLAGVALRGDETVSTTDTSLQKNLKVQFDANNYMAIQYITPFNNGNNVILGGKSGSNLSYYEVTDADVAPYDIWTVTIKGVNNTMTGVSSASLRAIRGDLTVTYNNAANKGHKTVYNNGTFFVDKGTIINASDLTFGGNTSAQALTTPQVTISNSGKTIIVDWTAGMPEGWYTMDVHSYTGSRVDIASWTNTAINNNADRIYAAEEELLQVLNGSLINYYHVNIGAEQTDRPAKHLIYLVKNSATSYSAQTISGHYFKDNGCADRQVNFITFTPHATEANVYNTVWCVWGNNATTNNNGGTSNGSSSIGATTAMIGKFSGNNTYYNFLPASTEPYNVYKVTIIGAPNAARINADTRVTLNHPDNKGLNRVYNGGRFFVAAGSTITAAHLSAPVVNDVTPKINVSPGSIVVDYTTEVTNVNSVTVDHTSASLAAGQSTKLNATVSAGAGTVPSLLWESSNPAVATVNVSGLVKAVGKGTAVITAKCGNKSATCTVTVSQPATGVNLSHSILDMELTSNAMPVQITSTVLPANSDETEVTWSSSDPKVAEVNNGTVTALTAGSTVITATCGKASNHCLVFVNATTGIESVVVEGNAGMMYDLQGRRVYRPQHGIYVRNGVKIKL